MGQIGDEASAKQDDNESTEDSIKYTAVPSGLTPRASTIFAFTLVVAVALGICQTRIFLVTLGKVYHGPNWVTEEIQHSKRLKEKVMAITSGGGASAREPAVVAHIGLLDERQVGIINDAVKALLGSHEVRASFPNFDGLPLEKTDAVIVPLWKCSSTIERPRVGITDAAAYLHGAAIDSNPEGLTIKEKRVPKSETEELESVIGPYPKTDGEPQMTLDGRPRIALNANVINEHTREELKTTLLHEFVHAHGVPAFKPSFSAVHTDLGYLPSYNTMIDTLNLEAHRRMIEWTLWPIILVGLYAACFFAYRGMMAGVAA